MKTLLASSQENRGVPIQEWDLEIKPRDKLFNLHFREVWNYRDLLWLLVRRDFVAFYKQTIFGPLWFFIQPIFTTFLFTVVFNRMGGFSTDGIPAPLFYMCGTIAWNYYAECLTKTSTVFKDNAYIFGKVYFPRLIMPLSIIFSNLVRFGVQFLLFLILLGYYMIQQGNYYFNEYVLLFPVILILMALQGLGLGLIITAMTTKYRDLTFVVTFGIQLLMFASPVIYSLSTIPEKYSVFVELNPLSGLIETYRFGFTGGGDFYQGAFIYSIIASLVIFISGIVVFNKVEKNFVDTI
ncbi:ABC transporter permease [Antarcticibacterium flavum]|uniref:Transport permease protein n=1 Tax=Antarcticibacterium flavum TaxID=2058175 RepID=A0A5B7WY53_9FLAO|nr:MULTISPECIES: ABC transporter permease [Antarcticibacterium]MCM4160811.1 ABC transporter permease [Antarcticibacterium sp. W02-3]QCY67980.1 ABC transporter permease [Antarcticibacterium flavum]